MTSSQKLIDLVSKVQRPISNSIIGTERILVPNQQIIPSDYNEIQHLFENELIKIIDWLKAHCQRHDKQIELDRIIMNLLPLLWNNEFQEVNKEKKSTL